MPVAQPYRQHNHPTQCPGLVPPFSVSSWYNYTWYYSSTTEHHSWRPALSQRSRRPGDRWAPRATREGERRNVIVTVPRGIDSPLVGVILWSVREGVIEGVTVECNRESNRAKRAPIPSSLASLKRTVLTVPLYCMPLFYSARPNIPTVPERCSLYLLPD